LTQRAVLDQLARRRVARRDLRAVDVTVRGHGHDGLHHEAGLLVEGQPAQQILHAFLDRQSRILVRIHAAVAVEVAVDRSVGVLLRGGAVSAHR
jgi:hypothetical protein